MLPSALPTLTHPLFTSKLRLFGLSERPTCSTILVPHHVLLAGIIILSAVFRLVNLGEASLTHTEAWRANYAIQSNGERPTRIHPPLLSWVSRLIQNRIGRTEVAVRFPAALAGIACVIVIYALCRRQFGIAPALGAAATAMCHPILVHYSRCNLEYAYEALMTSLVTWACLKVVRKPTTKRFVAFVGVSILSLTCTFATTLAIIAGIPIISWAYLRHSPSNRRRWTAWLGCMALLTAALLIWYFGHAGNPEQTRTSTYYDSVEVVWPQAYEWSALARWFVTSTMGALCFILGIAKSSTPVNWFVGTIGLFCAMAGFGFVWARSRAFCMFLALLSAEVIFAGALRCWPFGNIRHTTFLIPLFVILVGAGLVQLIRQLKSKMVTVFLVGACFVIPSGRTVLATAFVPAPDEHTRPVFEYIEQNHVPGDAMFVYYFARDAHEFYGRKCDMPVLVQPGADRGNLAAFAKRFDEWIQGHPRVWFVFAHDWQNEQAEWLDYLIRTYALLDGIEMRNASAHLFTVESPKHELLPTGDASSGHAS